MVETGGLEKQNRRFAISLKIQLNPFASCKLTTISFPLDLLRLCLFCATYSDNLVTVNGFQAPGRS